MTCTDVHSALAFGTSSGPFFASVVPLLSYHFGSLGHAIVCRILFYRRNCGVDGYPDAMLRDGRPVKTTLAVPRPGWPQE
ncbi:hypothetical protein EJ06DRAFT_41904 [Trichodelitschia bisporula]|uniref:Uncharacterized protein n=1 Tax=Trichodelitschia bisporula TaxID=703511 RepID=A0A6G1HVQ0_9PEZI|nr:hypothetical protein EJ06DRAFT_41904 [Trichodelitschia bisporula]